MNRLRLLLLCFASLFVADVSAQIQPVSGNASRLPSFRDKVDFEIREQPGCPLKLLFDDKLKDLPGSPVTLRNDGESTIAAAVLRVDLDSDGRNSMTIFGNTGLAAAQTRTVGLSAPRSSEVSGRPIVSVDFIQFVDGRTWGADSLGRSSHIRQFIEGRDLALKRLFELIAGQDDTEIRRALAIGGGASFGEPNSITARPRTIDYSARGYETILMTLRRLSRERERGQDLARELELAARMR